MRGLKQQTYIYVAATLGLEASLKPAPRLALAFHIKDAYSFAELQLELGHGAPLRLLLMLPVEGRYPGAVALKKHIGSVRSATDAVVVYVSKTLSATERRSLIGQQINFIQPGYQMFIPELAMDLRERLRKRRTLAPLTALLPATQALLLQALYRGWRTNELFTANALKGSRPYSRVTLTKVMAQLLELGIVQPGERQGAANTYRFVQDTTTTFNLARPYLRSPVKRRLSIDRTLPIGDGVVLAGETALAAYSELAEPPRPIYAMTKTVLDALPESAFKATEEIDEINAWIEIWAYPSLNEADLADEASLLLSLEGNPDERIQIALQTIKEQIKWLSVD
jgi:hypothetical protein